MGTEKVELQKKTVATRNEKSSKVTYIKKDKIKCMKICMKEEYMCLVKPVNLILNAVLFL